MSPVSTGDIIFYLEAVPMSVEAPSEPLDHSRIQLAVGGPGGRNAVTFHEPAYPAPDPRYFMVSGKALARCLFDVVRSGQDPWVYLPASPLPTHPADDTQSEPLPADTFSFYGGRIVIDPRRQSVRVSEEPVPLRGKEYALAVLLGRSPGTIYKTDALLERLWNGSSPKDNMDIRLKQLVWRTRQKLGRGAIVTIWNVGFTAAE